MKHLIFSLLLLFFFVEVFSVLPARITRTPEISKSQYVSGLINVHSHYSDGYLAIPELAAIAREAGHQFIVFGDKTTAEARKQNFDRDLGGIDSFVELEATTQSGQLLIFFSHSSASSFSDKEISRLGYERFLGKNAETPIFVSVSHPSHVKQPWTQLERFSDGLEVVNFDSLFWRQLSDAPLGFMGMSLLYPLNQFASALRFIQPYPKDFQTWDNMNTLDMGHFGLLSSQFKPKFQSPLNNISWPSYREIFRLGSNIVFLKEPLADSHSGRKKQIYESIKKARLALVFQAIHPFHGNDFYLECPNAIYRSGDIPTPGDSNCSLVVRTPETLSYPKNIRIWRNGELEKEVVNAPSVLRLPVGRSGSYRAEVFVRPHSQFWLLIRKWVPYVFYNPIFLR